MKKLYFRKIRINRIFVIIKISYANFYFSTMTIFFYLTYMLFTVAIFWHQANQYIWLTIYHRKN